jgi:DHA2 family multidrug resistance protein-like MFS transporter
MASPGTGGGPSGRGDEAPQRAGIVLTALIVIAGVANVNLSVGNVALPDIGKGLDAGQTGLNLVAVGFSLGLAASVLYLGALGDRYGRKQMVLGGMVLTVPAGLLAAFAPSVEWLVAGRVVGGVAAGMAYPTTLALVSALWSGRPATRAVALWSGVGGALTLIGPLVAGALLEQFWWGSVFLVSLPLAVVGLLMALLFVPSGVGESTEPVDNLGGILTIVMVAAIVMAVNFVPEAGMGGTAVGLALVGVAAVGAFILRQRRAPVPLFDLSVAARPTFWVAAVAGIIVFGSLMGGMFIGQQFMQNVLGYSPIEAGAAVLPMAIGMVGMAPVSARLIAGLGSRVTLLIGFAFAAAGFVEMLLLWNTDTPYVVVGTAYLLVGLGVGIAATPASHSLVVSVPVVRSGMASATADLQRDLGGAIMQSLMGAVLTAGYAAAVGSSIASAPPQAQDLITTNVESQLSRSYSSAADLAERYPQYADAIVSAARQSFLDGANWAYAAGIATMVLGAVLVVIWYPNRSRERELVATYAASSGSESVPAR